MNTEETYYFLGKCLTLSDNIDNKHDVIESIKQNNVDWLKFVKFANKHLVLASVYLRFKEHGILELIPTELANHLLNIYNLNKNRNLEIIEQIESINLLLNKENIHPIYLKGSANLIDNLYIDAGERIMGDIDFLVSDDEFEKAADILLKNGYATNIDFLSEDRKTIKHYPRMFHTTWPADVEVHRLPVELEYTNHFNHTVITQEKKLIENNSICYVLSDKHKLELNFIHGYLTSDVLFNFSFRNMLDFHLISKRVEAQLVINQFKENKNKANIYYAIISDSLSYNNNQTYNTIQASIVSKLHKVSLKSKIAYFIIWFINYLLFKIIVRYFKLITQFFLYKNTRKMIFNKLINPQWYRLHYYVFQTNWRKMRN